MPPRLRISIFLTSCIVSGCVAPSTFTLPSSGIAGSWEDASFDSAKMQEYWVQERREVAQQQIASVRRGAQAWVRDDSGRSYVGTVLESGPDVLVLMNCISQEVVPGPNGSQQAKTSHVPFQSFQASNVMDFKAISPPPPHFPASNEDIDCLEYTIAEVVTKNGRHHYRHGKPPEPADGY